jgi:hypothetical protein
MNLESSSFDDLGRISREVDGKTQGGREGKKELTGGESSDGLTRTKTEQIEEEEGKWRGRRRRRRGRRRSRRGWRTEETKGPLRSLADTHSPHSDTGSTNNTRRYSSSHHAPKLINRVKDAPHSHRAQSCSNNPQGGSSTAPKGAREGPASLFAVDRREPLTQEPVGAPLEVAQLAIAAKWCYVVYNQASCK